MGARELIAGLALAASCAGPSPRVVSVSLAPDIDGFRAVALVENDGGGRGQVALTVDLVDDEGRRFEAEEKVDLDGHERKHVAVQVPAPPGRYRAEAHAVYPVP